MFKSQYFTIFMGKTPQGLGFGPLRSAPSSAGSQAEEGGGRGPVAVHLDLICLSSYLITYLIICLSMCLHICVFFFLITWTICNMRSLVTFSEHHPCIPCVLIRFLLHRSSA